MARKNGWQLAVFRKKQRRAFYSIFISHPAQLARVLSRCAAEVWPCSCSGPDSSAVVLLTRPLSAQQFSRIPTVGSGSLSLARRFTTCKCKRKCFRHRPQHPQQARRRPQVPPCTQRHRGSSGESAAHLRHSSSCCMTVHAQQARALKVGCTAGAGWLHTGGLPALPRHGRGRAADAGAAAANALPALVLCHMPAVCSPRVVGLCVHHRQCCCMRRAAWGSPRRRGSRLASPSASWPRRCRSPDRQAACRCVAPPLLPAPSHAHVHLQGTELCQVKVGLLLQVLTFEHAFAILLVL